MPLSEMQMIGLALVVLVPALAVALLLVRRAEAVAA